MKNHLCEPMNKQFVCLPAWVGKVVNSLRVRLSVGNSSSTVQHSVRGCVLLSLLILPGCEVFSDSEKFGVVSGTAARSSVNGLAAHKRMWETAGAKVLTPKKLSPRLDDIDALVLVGSTYEPPSAEARRWLEGWLAEQPQRTVIYFGRDFDAGVYFRARTLEGLEDSEFAAGETELANRQAKALAERAKAFSGSAFSGSAFCRWFRVNAGRVRREYTSSELAGPWADSLAGLSGDWPVGVDFDLPDSSLQSRQPKWLAALATTSQVPPTREPGEGSIEPTNYTTVWSPSELATQEAWDAAFEGLPESKVLLQTNDDRPLVFELSSENFAEGSRVLVSANGAPFLNGGLVESLHRTVGAKIIEHCMPADRVAVIAYDGSGLTISDVAEKDRPPAGLEVLTVWPLSGVTMPAAIFGIILCASLIPILGRAQRMEARSVTDFGLHINALGRMLLDSRDESYAKQLIRDYHAKVRKDTPPVWAHPEGQAQQEKVPSPAAPANGSSNPADNND